MIHRVPKIVQLGLIIVTITILGACSSGPGSSNKPVPAWSPPNWMHGTWKFSGEGGSATLVASRHNVKLDFKVSGVSYTIDAAQLAEDGAASITHEAGIERGYRFYSLFIESDGEVIVLTGYRDSSTTISGYITTSTGTAGPIPFVKQ